MLLLALVLPTFALAIDAAPGVQGDVTLEPALIPTAALQLRVDAYLADAIAVRAQVVGARAESVGTADGELALCFAPMLDERLRAWTCGAAVGGALFVQPVDSDVAILPYAGLAVGVGARWTLYGPLGVHASFELPVVASYALLLPRIGVGVSAQFSL
jgi:hypothetical protein